ncbi:hypothetical protein [Jeotgalibaca dankookensis]|uniref:hypothetical protein n=1 Tax=Jeotgalibaca dankookensis TaxID=708126 RepID=UPI00078445A9|nr:hypothetical protein [Jeotgalibaca dankookensis]
MMRFLKTNELVQQVYNDGIVELKEKVPSLDEYGTPIPGRYTYELQLKSWWRTLGITSQEDLNAKAIEKTLTKKIGLPGNQEVSSRWRAFIGTREFEIFRSYYNYKKDETEISLVEVDK